MTITATGPLSVPFAGLARLVASSETFQEMVGESSETQALDHVYYPLVDDPSVKRPFALVTADESTSWRMDRQGRQSGSLILVLERAVSAEVEEDHPQELLEFNNIVGAILTEMRDHANTPGLSGEHYWNAVDWRQIQPPLINQPLTTEADESGRFFFSAEFEIFWN